MEETCVFAVWYLTLIVVVAVGLWRPGPGAPRGVVQVLTAGRVRVGRRHGVGLRMLHPTIHTLEQRLVQRLSGKLRCWKREKKLSYLRFFHCGSMHPSSFIYDNLQIC